MTADYANLKLLHSGDNSEVYRAIRVTDNQPVVLKKLKSPYPTPEQIRRYRQEYQLIGSLQSPNVIRAYALEEQRKSFAIILEDVGGIAIGQWLAQREQSLTIGEFLPLALKIAEGLKQLHAHHIIHKDINPSNIVVNPATGVVKIIDLGIATQLDRETPLLKAPRELEGTLPYLSPEQTGRMNRTLDYRSDFYSLGATFYEMLTGAPPFVSTDPMELVHCHIAREPVPLHRRRLRGDDADSGDLPAALSDIVMKLMAKNVEDRYQSASGLQADLSECLVQWRKDARVTSFPLGTKDISGQFQIPQKLYGRRQERAALVDAFERMAGGAAASESAAVDLAGERSSPAWHGAQWVLVTGYSGIGKSCLVQELYRPITERRARFVSGKFDPFKTTVPYTAVIDAFTDLVKKLLSEPESVLMQWRADLTEALGANGQLLVDVIPALELIIGKQPPVPDLGPVESRNRFNLVLQRFIGVFCRADQPLVMFLDDLQWADLATLSLIERLLEDRRIKHCLLIGAYRHNEVSATHPLMLLIEQARRKNIAVEQLFLRPLDSAQVGKMIAETLHRSIEESRELIDLVMRKTDGNPFFVKEFLKRLHSEELLRFAESDNRWTWDLERINAIGLADNVVDLMVGRLRKLPASVQRLLAFAACQGVEFDLSTLSTVLDRSAADVGADLRLAMNQGLVASRSPPNEDLLILDYKFGHDRIQQAAYSLIPEQDQATRHYQIGRSLLAQLSWAERENAVFAIVEQLNRCLRLIDDPNERVELARLNLLACKKARAAAAYQAASAYAAIGLEVLGDDGWHQHYALALALHDLAAEMASLTGNDDRMERVIAAIIIHSNSVLDQIDSAIVKIQALVSRNQPVEALSAALSILNELGVQFPETPTGDDIHQAIQEVSQLIGNQSVEELSRLPPMTDRKTIAVVRIIASIFAASFQAGTSLLPLLYALQVNFTLRHGHTPASAFNFACYAVVLANVARDVATASRFCRLALRMASQDEAKSVRAATYNVVGICVYHRSVHLRETLPIFQAGYETGLETGNLEYAGYNAQAFSQHALWSGKPLSEIEPQINAYRQHCLDLNQVTAANYCLNYWETAVSLLDNPEHVALVFDRQADEEQLVAQAQASGDFLRIAGFYVHRMMLRYLLGDYALAQADAEQARHAIGSAAGFNFEAGLYFYESLIALAPRADADADAVQPPYLSSETYRQRVAKSQDELWFWAQHAPMNYLHKWQLVEAERHRVAGRRIEASELYDLAISGAHEQLYIQEEALANELAGKFYLAWGKEASARACLLEARYCYAQWGAIRKVRQLETEYPRFFQSPQLPASPSPYAFQVARHTNDARASAASLDLSAIMKASRAIAGELVLDRLLQRLMAILLENAGACAGCLLLHTPAEDGSFGPFAVAVGTESGVTAVPESIVNYVARTLESVVLDNAAGTGRFVHDPYIQSSKPLSVLCYPLLNQGKPVAIVYLENSITTGAFTADRVEFLQLLSGQAAIAITNAQLYAEKAEYTRTLEQKVAERTRELEAANARLSALSNTDGLTGIANRRRFDEVFQLEWNRAQRSGSPLSVALLDVDWFKKYNDHYGHQAGDDCLCQVARVFADAACRAGDLAARYGGEEFVLLAPATDSPAALSLTTRICQKLEQLAIPHALSPYGHITASIGVATLVPTDELQDDSPKELLNRADAALYQAKEQGRNRALADCDFPKQSKRGSNTIP